MTSPVIMLASDLSARCDRATDRAFLLADALGARVVLVHVAEPGIDDSELLDRAKEAMESTLSHRDQPVELVVRTGRVDTEVLEVARLVQPRLIVTGVARFNGVREFLLGTTVEHLVHKAKAPILIVKRRVAAPYRRPLVAVDFSRCSMTALLTAMEMFPDEPIGVVHCCHAAYEAWLDRNSSANEIKRQAEEEMSAFVRAVAQAGTVTRHLEPRIEIGETETCIARLMREGFDLLAIGAHGRSALGHLALGSSADTLLSRIDADVLLVRRSARLSSTIDAECQTASTP